MHSFFLFFLILFAGNSCNTSSPTLKDSFKDQFYVGTALNQDQIDGLDPEALQLAGNQFNSITAENCMKWGKIHPLPGVYKFEPADSFVEYGENNGMYIVGHCLVWHSQTPDWVFQDESGSLTVRDTLLQRMHDHILAVVGRYKGRVDCWDVVNEPIEDDGQIRKSMWSEIIGEDFIQKAFEYAREADPEAVLILNDYSLPNSSRREGMVRLISDLQSEGVMVDGVGMQGHYQLDYPKMSDLEASILAFSDLGVKVMITELDINVLPRANYNTGADLSNREEYLAKLNPYTEGLPDSVGLLLAGQYGDLFTLFVKHADKIDRVTLWGVHDGQSWKNNWPVRGRTNYPLLFDRNYQPKMAFESVIKTAGHK